jgi:hypothetical protein
MTNLKLFSIQFVSIWNLTLAVWNSLLSQQKVKWAIIFPKSTRNHQKSTNIYHQQRNRKFIRVWNSSSSTRLFSCWSISFGNMWKHELFKDTFQTHNLMKNVRQNYSERSKRKIFHLPNGILVARCNANMPDRSSMSHFWFSSLFVLLCKSFEIKQRHRSLRVDWCVKRVQRIWSSWFAVNPQIPNSYNHMIRMYID